MVSKHLKWSCMAVALAALLSACGGGTGTGTSTGSDTPAKSTEAEQASTGNTAGPGKITDMDTGRKAEQEEENFHEANATPVVAQPAATTNAGMRTAGALSTTTPTSGLIDLGVPPVAEITSMQSKNRLQAQGNANDVKAKVYQIGFTRPVPGLATSAATAAALRWEPTPTGGYLTRIQLRSEGAVKLRVGLLVEQLPATASVRIQGEGDAQAQELDGSFINSVLASNRQADGISADTQTYWLPSSMGALATLEIEIAAGTTPASVQVAIPRLSHGVETAISVAQARASAKSACPQDTPDATCSLPSAANAINSSASYDFMVCNSEGTCSGTLISDKAGSAANFFLTAHHCVGSQTVASTAVFYWFNRSATCDGLTENPGATQSAVQGATYLFGQSVISPSPRNPTGTDTSLLRLLGTPPVGTHKAGWTIDAQPVSNTVLTGIHHPAPIFQNTTATWARRSDGRITGYGNALSETIDGALVGYETNNRKLPLYRVNWNTGITESGSSGSALFRNATTANPQVVGQLYGGSSSCAILTNPDVYGRFDIGYEDGMINHLNPGFSMVFRMYNTLSGVHFYTSSSVERNNARQNIPAYLYEGTVYTVGNAPAAGRSPVFRFFNRATGTHFYTISTVERDRVLATAPNFVLEGVAWYASLSSAAGTIPIYRFFLPSQGTHFYTASEVERDNVIAQLSGVYSYEGVAYHAWPRY
jgi:lysyl endopeptidase